MIKIKAFGILLYKVKKNSVEVLLCKSVKSLDKWGCLKGMSINDETSKECAKREFFEECAIKVETYLFEEYFFQENPEKDIGIWIVNANKIDDLEDYFADGKLLDVHLSWENSKVKFFDIKDLPAIKKKQKNLVKDITDFLQNKHLSH